MDDSQRRSQEGCQRHRDTGFQKSRTINLVDAGFAWSNVNTWSVNKLGIGATDFKNQENNQEVYRI